MFKRILLPVDGSLSSVPVVRKCLAFASDAGAEVLAIHVLPEAPENDAAFAQDDLLEGRRAVIARAERILDEVEVEAQQYRVPCRTELAYDDQPYRGIIDAAGKNGSDLICMASHGRTGASAVILGSETQKVLTHSQIPVLVLR